MSHADLDADTIAAHDFLKWNRSESAPPVSITKELFVARKAIEFYKAAIASQAPAAQQEPLDLQRTKNPYTIGTPEAYWRRGYNGERMIGHPGCAAEQFYKEGALARKNDDLAAPSPQGDAEDAARLALQRVASSLRGAGAQLPAPDVKGTIESSMNTGMCIALSIVESEIAAVDAARKASLLKGGSQ